MMQGLELTGLAATIALLLPLAALIIVIVLALRRSASSLSETDRGHATLRHAAPLAGRRAAPPPLAKAGATREAAGAPEPARESQDLSHRIAHAEANGDESRLVELYFSMARQELGAGRVAEASDHLRKSIRLATKLGSKPVHAQARLELGDIACASGDLTTACEHWQIARGLFFELKHKGTLDATEARMRQNGCPTDWVLNDF